jgi:hypothetical protein
LMLRVTLGKTDARTARGKLYFYDTISTTPRFEPSAGRGGSNQIGSWPSIPFSVRRIHGKAKNVVD